MSSQLCSTEQRVGEWSKITWREWQLSQQMPQTNLPDLLLNKMSNLQLYIKQVTTAWSRKIHATVWSDLVICLEWSNIKQQKWPKDENNQHWCRSEGENEGFYWRPERRRFIYEPGKWLKGLWGLSKCSSWRLTSRYKPGYRPQFKMRLSTQKQVISICIFLTSLSGLQSTQIYILTRRLTVSKWHLPCKD